MSKAWSGLCGMFVGFWLNVVSMRCFHSGDKGGLKLNGDEVQVLEITVVGTRGA